MGWSNYDHYNDDWCGEDRGGNDEYYSAHCADCDEVTEHDVCTDECVEC
jgi:hypothetical protein